MTFIRPLSFRSPSYTTFSFVPSYPLFLQSFCAVPISFFLKRASCVHSSSNRKRTRGGRIPPVPRYILRNIRPIRGPVPLFSYFVQLRRLSAFHPGCLPSRPFVSAAAARPCFATPESPTAKKSFSAPPAPSSFMGALWGSDPLLSYFYFVISLCQGAGSSRTEHRGKGERREGA